jgi:hypothetical protein
MIFWKTGTHAAPALPIPHSAMTHCVTALMVVGLGTLVEPASAQLRTGCQNTKGASSRAASRSRPFLLHNHCTWKAGERVRGTMPRRALGIGAVLLTLSVFSSPSLAAAERS